MNTIQRCILDAPIDNKEELCEIEERMRPRSYSEVGFLMPDQALADVIESDAAYLHSMHITCRQIADCMRTIYGKFLRTKDTLSTLPNSDDIDFRRSDTWLLVEDRFWVKHKVWRGAQICPFRHADLEPGYSGYEYGSVDVTVQDSETQQCLTFNTLLPHMIEKHGFFEGPDCKHRVEPRAVIDMFRLQPCIDYAPENAQEQLFMPLSTTQHANEVLNGCVRFLLDHFCMDKSISLLPGYVTWLMPSDWLNPDRLLEWQPCIEDLVAHIAISKTKDYAYTRRKYAQIKRQGVITGVVATQWSKRCALEHVLESDEDIERCILHDLARISKFRETGTVDDYCTLFVHRDPKCDVPSTETATTKQSDGTALYGRHITPSSNPGWQLFLARTFTYTPIDNEKLLLMQHEVSLERCVRSL